MGQKEIRRRYYERRKNDRRSGDGVEDGDASVKNNGAKPASQKTTTARTIEEAALLTVVPKSFVVNSSLVWQAKYVTEREFNWKHTDDIGEWLDTYLWWTMKKLGVVLGGYVVERSPVAASKSDGR